jgi:hypothetical protein
MAGGKKPVVMYVSEGTRVTAVSHNLVIKATTPPTDASSGAYGRDIKVPSVPVPSPALVKAVHEKQAKEAQEKAEKAAKAAEKGKGK